MEDKIIRGAGPTAVKSKLGYLLSGPIKQNDRQMPRIGMHNILLLHKPEEFNLEELWSLESIIGVKRDDTEIEAVHY